MRVACLATRTLIIFSVLLLIFIVQVSAKETLTIKERIALIPEEDQKVLHDFFHDMLSQGDFAEVLLGSKPSSLHDRVWWLIKLKNRRIKNFILLTYIGSQTWEKYSHLFPSHKFFILNGKYHKGIFPLWFAKKKYEDSIIEYNKHPFSGVEEHNQLGKLLGYPIEDVDAFCKEKHILYTLNYFPYDTEELIYSPEQSVEDLIDDPVNDPITLLEQLREDFKFNYFTTAVEPFFPTGIHGHCTFSENFNDESAWKQKVADLYNSDNFLEEILTIICE